MTVNLNNIKLAPNLDSIQRLKISDKEYFSNKYSNYISNSRLKLINPKQQGSPSKYKQGFTGEITTSLSLGSAIHALFLESETFKLGPDLCKPSAKLGLVIDKIREYRNKGFSIDKAIQQACQNVHYYENNVNSKRIKSIISSGLKYYCQSKSYNNDNIILLSTKDRNIVQDCLSNLNNHYYIKSLINPDQTFKSYNEDTFLIDIDAQYNKKQCSLKLKMKADNWSVNPEKKILILNDLKTTGHLVNQFMQPGGSMENFHYHRQFAMYLWILTQYCKQQYDFNDKDWSVYCNVIVVETSANHNACAYQIKQPLIEQGQHEFNQLLKMVAYCEMHDYSDDIIFI